MRKVHKNPDGTEEVLEGEPEELRKYEDLQKPEAEQAPINESPKKPGILHGAEVDGVPLTETEKEWVRLLRNFPKLPEPVIKTSPITPWPGPNPGPIWIVSCSICHRAGCNGSCYGMFAPPWYTITCTSDNTLKPEPVSLLLQVDGTSKLSHGLSDVLMGRATVEVKTNEN